MSPLAGLHNGIANGIDTDVRVLGCRCDNWIQARWGGFGDILPHSCNGSRELPVWNRIGLRDDCLKCEFKPCGSLDPFVERLEHHGVDFVEAVPTVEEDKDPP
jgi:hypothetical protein